jgi:glycine cleavage system T protein (aminomethyltransferase)
VAASNYNCADGCRLAPTLWKEGYVEIKQTPFHEVGLQAGAEMQELFGYWLPWQYERGHVEEHLATRTRVSICDLDYMAEFKIVGPAALQFAQTLLTNDFSNLAGGRVRYTAMCDLEGNMVDDGTLWRLGDNEYVLITGSEGDFDWVSSQASRFDVDVTNITSEWTTLAVQGPESRSVIEALVGPGVVDSIPYYGFVPTNVTGSDCLLARMGYTGEFGYEFHLAPEGAEALWRGLLEKGKSKDLLPCGQAALESLRQEAGYLLVGNDHDPTTNPFEAGIGRVVSFSKPEFNGREALAAVKKSGISRTMVWMKLKGTEVVNSGDPILIEGIQIGQVTSGSYSPTQKRGVAMGYVEPTHAISGIDVDIRMTGIDVPATISLMPLYDPGDVRTRQR